MFSQACVKNSVHKEGRHAWQEGICGGGGHAWQGPCVAGACMTGRACVAGETATAVVGTYPTGMHSFVITDYSPHRDELSDPVVSVTKAASSDEQAVQLGVDSSSRNQSLSQGLHPPDPSGSYPGMHAAK